MVWLRLDHFGLDRADFGKHWIYQKHGHERSIHSFQRQPEKAAALCSDNCMYGLYCTYCNASEVRDWFENTRAETEILEDRMVIQLIGA